MPVVCGQTIPMSCLQQKDSKEELEIRHGSRIGDLLSHAAQVSTKT